MAWPQLPLLSVRPAKKESLLVNTSYTYNVFKNVKERPFSTDE